MLNLVQQENEQDQAHIFSDIYFESCQIYQVTIMYCFKRTRHDILLNFFISKSLQTPFPCA